MEETVIIFLKFLKRPHYDFHKRKTSVILTALIYFVFCFCIMLIANGLMRSIFLSLDILPQNKLNEFLTGFQGKNFLFFTMIILIIPLFEEVVFRLPLQFSVVNTFLSLACISTYFIIIFLKEKWEVIIPMLILMYLLILATINFFRHGLISFWEKRFNYIVYFSSLLFGLVHIYNFNIDENIHYLVSFCLIIPYIIVGLILSFVRIYYKHGFTIITLTHVLLNFIASIPLLAKITS